MLGWLFGRKSRPAAGSGAPSDTRAALERAFAQQTAGRLEEADAAYREILKREPADFDALHLRAVVALQTGRPQDAEALLARALAVDPRRPAALNNLGEAQRLLGRLPEAAASYRAALEGAPDYFDALFNLGGVLLRLGETREARAALERALALQPENAQAHHRYGLLLQGARETDGALAAFQRAVALEPGNARMRLDAGNLLREKGFLDEAAAAYREAIVLAPTLAAAHNNLGNVLRHQGKVQEALGCYEQALAQQPDFVDALLNAAQLLREQGRLAQAATAYRALLGARPDLAEAHLDLGNALKGMADREGALACYREACARDPELAEARWALAMSQPPMIAESEAAQAQSRADFVRELAALDAWCAERPAEQTARAVGTQQPFYLAYQEADHREAMARYGALCARLMGDWQQATRLPMPARITRAETRVGIVSAHVHDHSVWNALVKGWLQNLDRNRYDLRLFHLGVTNDVETALAKTLVSHYAYGKSDLVDWTQLILAQQLDVLIYPEIGMDPNTAKLASLRLAPVQAASWGHPHTTGLPTIDYFLSAEALEPPGAEAHYTERLVPLPGLGCCLAAPQPVAAEVDLAALGIRGGVPLLLCPGTPFKYTPRHDAVLAEIARRLGDCQLVFFAPQTPELVERLRARMTRGFAAAGADFGAAAVFVPWQRRASFFGLMREADVCLDTLGFSGFNTALQAIECGLPIVGYEGRFLRGRLASGVLRRLGLDALVATTEREYVEAVVRLAREAAWWGEARERMAAARPRLYGDTAPARALEGFFERALSAA
jgi:predicted O-linked N-acetylglucosamine transferase (SPINDLY family)